MGHVDFYPNGGTHQPGCPDSVIGGIFSHLLHDISRKFHDTFAEFIKNIPSNGNIISWNFDNVKYFAIHNVHRMYLYVILH